MTEKFQQPKQTISGLELLERGDKGYERYRLEPGSYQINFGFRNFGQHEDDWFSRASDRESDWETPFVFDFDHPAVTDFAEQLFRGQTNFTGPEAVRSLSERLGELIRSMSISEPEYNNSLSDVVTSRQGMCDAKSVLFGSMLARHTNLEAQAIVGQYGKVKERVSYPFHHQWMRIAEGNNVYLFDPMYKRFAAFEQEGDNFFALDNEDSHFTNLTPGCYPAAKLMTQMDIRRFGGVIKIVESHKGDSHEVYVENEESLPVQLTNNAAFAFALDEAQELEIQDGAVKTGQGDTSMYFPVKKFQKI
jgi:hypothetical protein